ncbi:DNA polymerase III subunit [Candidatus Solirubrobacter pratensis]|uniref:DNA polymerase III subunit n=1 Tax=Candidatus Solirubrobacter pratensis TaxID=1298857 RepID=UPI0003F682BD|nr:ATP-binding protein [Candidatus Solirubrobacter pratensis]
MLALDAHPHARAVLGAALSGEPAHAYLLHGPAGAGKRETARAFAGELLARGARDPGSARARAAHGAHPDLTWVTPSGAHEMLRRDVEEAVVAAAAHTPFEATRRVFVLERADTMNDEAANALLKTLEEPPPYVVLVLLTDRLTQVLPTIASRCQPVRFDALGPGALAQKLQSQGVPPETAEACARLSLGDGEKALALALGDGPALRAAAEALARAPLQGRRDRPWEALLERSKARGAAARAEVEAALAEELQYLPKKEHRRRETEYGERARRAQRRAETGALDHALQLAGLWLRDVGAVAAGAPELAFNADRAAELAADAEGRSPTALRAAQELVDDTRARLQVNVGFELACEALAFRLEETLAT